MIVLTEIRSRPQSSLKDQVRQILLLLVKIREKFRHQRKQNDGGNNHNCCHFRYSRSPCGYSSLLYNEKGVLPIYRQGLTTTRVLPFSLNKSYHSRMCEDYHDPDEEEIYFSSVLPRYWNSTTQNPDIGIQQLNKHISSVIVNLDKTI